MAADGGVGRSSVQPDSSTTVEPGFGPPIVELRSRPVVGSMMYVAPLQNRLVRLLLGLFREAVMLTSVPTRPSGSFTLVRTCVPGSAASTRSAAPRSFGGAGISNRSLPAAAKTAYSRSADDPVVPAVVG